MCFGQVDAPEPVEIKKPVFVRNPFLDDEDDKARTADAMRRGRSSLVIPTGTGIGFSGADGSAEAGAGGAKSAIGPGGIAGSGSNSRYNVGTYINSPGPGGPGGDDEQRPK